VILALDVSGSMEAADLYPSRMEAAKAAGREFVAREPSGIQIGVVSFSDYATLVQAPTRDHTLVLKAINLLHPENSTAIGMGLLTSLEALSQSHHPVPSAKGDAQVAATSPHDQAVATIVLLTDGENTFGPAPLEIARQAAQRGVRIITVGLDSPQGTFIRLGGYSFHTSLNEATLKEIASITSGNYYNALTETDLSEIYRKLSTHAALQPQKVELTAAFAGVAALLSVTALFLSLLWSNRLP